MCNRHSSTRAVGDAGAGRGASVGASIYNPQRRSPRTGITDLIESIIICSLPTAHHPQHTFLLLAHYKFQQNIAQHASERRKQSIHMAGNMRTVTAGPLKLAEFVVSTKFRDLGIVCECVSFIEALHSQTAFYLTPNESANCFNI